MFLADRYIKGECPKCHAKDQYGDACEVCGSVYSPTELVNPYSSLSGAPPVLKTSDHYFFRLSDPRCAEFLKEWIDTPGHLQPQVANKAREWLEGKGDRPLGDWDISRDAPYFGIPIPDAPGKYLLCVARCAHRLSRELPQLLRTAGNRLRGVPDRARHGADPLHRQGHHLFPHAVLAGDAAGSPAPLQGAGQHSRARFPDCLGREDVEVPRHRHQSA